MIELTNEQLGAMEALALENEAFGFGLADRHGYEHRDAEVRGTGTATELTDTEPSPCPVCGSPNVVYYKAEGHPRHHFECCECSAFSKCQPTYEEALASWNRRTSRHALEPIGRVGYTVHGTQYVNWLAKAPTHGTLIYAATQPAQPKAEVAPLTDDWIIELAGLAPNRRVCASTCMTRKIDKKPCHCYPGMRNSEALDLAYAVEAEVRKQDGALIQQLVEAPERIDATMPFPVAHQAITAGRARLKGKL